MKFVATTANVTIGVGAYLRIVPEGMVGRPRPSTIPEDQRPFVSPFAAQPPPDMPAGASVLLGGKTCPVLWADRSRAVVEIAGRAWLMSHMTPSEMSLHRDSYDAGSRVQEWIIRRSVDDLSEFGH